jgi:hypothetical protein
MTAEIQHVRPLRVATAPGSRADQGFRSRAALPKALAPGLPATPAHDLKFHGGRVIADLEYVNFYVSSANWDPSDIDSIDRALEKAMTESRLNNVMAQYFPAGRLTSTFRASVKLTSPRPAVVSQGDVEGLVRLLFRQGRLSAFSLESTVLNFFLPQGTVLNTDETPTQGLLHAEVVADEDADSPIPHEEEDSEDGLGGFHGSIHVTTGGSRVTLYYAVGVYSEKRSDGSTNGIVAFDEPWKNVVATFYHELNEARTDPDVEDAIRTDSDRFLGWTSSQGEECGDFPVFEAHPLSLVFQEIEVDGDSAVPVQFQYSNAVHGPEGPIDKPNPPLIS